ncbi:MAG: acyl-CoA dehydrogenase family protein [Pseudomonadota bacterium]
MNANTAEIRKARSLDDLLKIIDEIGESTIAAHAADADRDARFPSEAFDALKKHGFLSVYIPSQFGGDGLTITEVCRLCESLSQYDASVAMIFAMHQIQIACIVDHASDDEFFVNYMREISDKQLLLASATTEIGVGGDVRSSICAVVKDGDRFTLTKKAPVISYAKSSDAIMVTCRSSEDAPDNDQSVVLVKTEDRELEQIAGWDTLGFRATCSSGFVLTSSGDVRQVMTTPYAEVLGKSMHPVSHLTWGSLWTGIAASAVEVARKTVREAARKNPNAPPVSALRLSEVNELLFSMRSGLYEAIDEYQRLLDAGNDDAFENFGFAIKINNVKVRCSEMVVDIVGKALQIVGISGYKNDSSKSLSRHLRDAYGASLMVNNDRIRGHNATMQIAYRGK